MVQIVPRVEDRHIEGIGAGEALEIGQREPRQCAHLIGANHAEMFVHKFQRFEELLLRHAHRIRQAARRGDPQVGTDVHLDEVGEQVHRAPLFTHVQKDSPTMQNGPN